MTHIANNLNPNHTFPDREGMEPLLDQFNWLYIENFLATEKIIGDIRKLVIERFTNARMSSSAVRRSVTKLIDDLESGKNSLTGSKIDSAFKDLFIAHKGTIRMVVEEVLLKNTQESTTRSLTETQAHKKNLNSKTTEKSWCSCVLL